MDTDINILLLGETGVGKSTFINSFANYIKFPTLKAARQAELVCLIPTKFTIADDDYVEHVVRFGEDDGNEDHTTGSSSTQEPMEHVFEVPGLTSRVRIIDTPGVGDARGIEQDEKNIRKTVGYLKNYTHLNAVCFVLKPTVTILNEYFKFCVTHLFSCVEKTAGASIVFAFTNTRSTFYRPGETMTLLQRLLREIAESPPHVQVPFSKGNIFCVDNEAFRYLMAMRAGHVFKENEVEDFTESWRVSASTYQEMLRYVATLEAHPIVAEVSAVEVRDRLRPLLRELVNIYVTMLTHLDYLDCHQGNLVQKPKRTDLALPQLDHIFQLFDAPILICKSLQCNYKEDLHRDIFRQKCHAPCTCAQDQCSVLSKNFCKVCKCPVSNHHYILYEARHFHRSHLSLPPFGTSDQDQVWFKKHMKKLRQEYADELVHLQTVMATIDLFLKDCFIYGGSCEISDHLNALCARRTRGSNIVDCILKLWKDHLQRLEGTNTVKTASDLSGIIDGLYLTKHVGNLLSRIERGDWEAPTTPKNTEGTKSKPPRPTTEPSPTKEPNSLENFNARDKADTSPKPKAPPEGPKDPKGLHPKCGEEVRPEDTYAPPEISKDQRGLNIGSGSEVTSEDMSAPPEVPDITRGMTPESGKVVTHKDTNAPPEVPGIPRGLTLGSGEEGTHKDTNAPPEVSDVPTGLTLRSGEEGIHEETNAPLEGPDIPRDLGRGKEVTHAGTNALPEVADVPGGLTLGSGKEVTPEDANTQPEVPDVSRGLTQVSGEVTHKYTNTPPEVPDIPRGLTLESGEKGTHEDTNAPLEVPDVPRGLTLGNGEVTHEDTNAQPNVQDIPRGLTLGSGEVTHEDINAEDAEAIEAEDGKNVNGTSIEKIEPKQNIIVAENIETKKELDITHIRNVEREKEDNKKFGNKKEDINSGYTDQLELTDLETNEKETTTKTIRVDIELPKKAEGTHEELTITKNQGQDKNDEVGKKINLGKDKGSDKLSEMEMGINSNDEVEEIKANKEPEKGEKSTNRDIEKGDPHWDNKGRGLNVEAGVENETAKSGGKKTKEDHESELQTGNEKGGKNSRMAKEKQERDRNEKVTKDKGAIAKVQPTDTANGNKKEKEAKQKPKVKEQRHSAPIKASESSKKSSPRGSSSSSPVKDKNIKKPKHEAKKEENRRASRNSPPNNEDGSKHEKKTFIEKYCNII